MEKHSFLFPWTEGEIKVMLAVSWGIDHNTAAFGRLLMCTFFAQVTSVRSVLKQSPHAASMGCWIPMEGAVARSLLAGMFRKG